MYALRKAGKTQIEIGQALGVSQGTVSRELSRNTGRRGKCYNRRGAQHAGRGVIPHRIDIAERPLIVASKSRLGDWEGDTIVGAQHKGALLTQVERKSLFTTISKLPRPTATAAHRATVHRLNPLRTHVHTITAKSLPDTRKPPIFYAPRSSLPRPITRGNAV